VKISLVWIVENSKVGSCVRRWSGRTCMRYAITHFFTRPNRCVVLNVIPRSRLQDRSLNVRTAPTNRKTECVHSQSHSQAPGAANRISARAVLATPRVGPTEVGRIGSKDRTLKWLIIEAGTVKCCVIFSGSFSCVSVFYILCEFSTNRARLMYWQVFST
jgi:hypothetical protein